jgi:hypothetical protein
MSEIEGIRRMDSLLAEVRKLDNGSLVTRLFALCADDYTHEEVELLLGKDRELIVGLVVHYELHVWAAPRRAQR